MTVGDNCIAEYRLRKNIRHEQSRFKTHQIIKDFMDVADSGEVLFYNHSGWINHTEAAHESIDVGQGAILFLGEEIGNLLGWGTKQLCRHSRELEARFSVFRVLAIDQNVIEQFFHLGVVETDEQTS